VLQSTQKIFSKTMAVPIESPKYNLLKLIKGLLEAHPTKGLFEAHHNKGLFEAHHNKGLIEAHPTYRHQSELGETCQ